MKTDVLAWAKGTPTRKLAAKETLNHRELIEMVSGLNAFEHTAAAYKRAYQALGIDIINRVPLERAPQPTPAGVIRKHPTLPYSFASLGVYDTAMRHTYACVGPEDVWSLDLAAIEYDDLITPVPHPCQADDIISRTAAIGDVGLYYPMLYTTLFMWPVEVLGWENFLIAAQLEPERFHDHFFVPCLAKSKAIGTEIARASDSPFVFVHDDLAQATGPMFRPTWYNQYIFPHYPEIWGEAKKLGKKIIFVIDGNITAFLPHLVEAGVDGVMFETPATGLEAVVDHFGQSGRYFIGGISTFKMTTGSPADVWQMVVDLIEQVGHYPGFAIASGGGLHGNVPLPNLEAYFDARAEFGINPKDWRSAYRV